MSESRNSNRQKCWDGKWAFGACRSPRTPSRGLGSGHWFQELFIYLHQRPSGGPSHRPCHTLKGASWRGGNGRDASKAERPRKQRPEAPSVQTEAPG